MRWVGRTGGRGEIRDILYSLCSCREEFITPRSREWAGGRGRGLLVHLEVTFSDFVFQKGILSCGSGVCVEVLVGFLFVLPTTPFVEVLVWGISSFDHLQKVNR